MGLRTGTGEKNAQGFRYIFTESSKILWVLGALVGLLCLVLAGVFLRTGAIDALTREGQLRTLTDGLTPGQRAQGRVQVRGRVNVGAGGEPLCRAEHQYYVSGKNGGWRTQATVALGQLVTITTSDGREVPVTVVHAPNELRFEPTTYRAPSAAESELANALMFRQIVRSGRVVVDCAEEGSEVFIEGCVSSVGGVTACANGPMVATYGDGTVHRRVVYVANEIAAKLAGGAIALLVLLGLLWLYVRARPQVNALLSWADAKKAPRWWIGPVVVGVLDLLAACVLALNRETYGRRGNVTEISPFGHWWLWVAVGLLLTTALAAVYRRGALRRVAKLMDDTPTSKLSQVSGGKVELAVKTTGTATVFPGTASEEPLRGVLFDEPLALLHVYVTGTSGQGKMQVTRGVGPETLPDELRVRDESGDGVLRTRHADFDLEARAIQCDAERYRNEFEPRYEKLFGNNWNVPNAHTYRIEESALRVSDALYVFGEVQAVKPGEGSDYRHAGVVAEVGGSEDKRIVVHAGTERSLRELVRSETQFVTGFVWTAATLALAIANADVWLLTR